MKLSHTIAPALAAILVAGCATHTTQASAPERAEQAEADKQHAQDEARQARVDAEEARRQAQDAARAQHEADVKAQYAAQTAAEAERDARAERTGVPEPQPMDRRVTVATLTPGVAFVPGSSDLTTDEKVKLDDVAVTLREHPAQKVILEAYPDETSTDAYLSHRRAETVAHYLENRGISSARIQMTVGKWDTTDEAIRRRRAHRRVEIIVQ